MYAAVPRMIPACVARPETVGKFIAFALPDKAGSIDFASPMSSS
jgi:hypothetical protein